MIKKNTWIVLIIFALLAALGLFLEFGNGKFLGRDLIPPTTTPAQDAKLNMYLENECSEIEFKTNSHTVSIVRGQSNLWKLVHPANTTTDLASLEMLITEWFSMDMNPIVAQPPNLSDAGLDTGRLTVKVTYKNAQTEEFVVGNKTPVGNGTYVQKVMGNIVVVNQSSINNVNQYLESISAQAAP